MRPRTGRGKGNICVCMLVNCIAVLYVFYSYRSCILFCFSCSYVEFIRNKDTSAGSKMDALKKYILQRDQKKIRAEERKKSSSASSASQPVPHPSRPASPPPTATAHGEFLDLYLA